MVGKTLTPSNTKEKQKNTITNDQWNFFYKMPYFKQAVVQVPYMRFIMIEIYFLRLLKLGSPKSKHSNVHV